MRTLDRVEILSAKARIVPTNSPARRCVVTVTVRDPEAERVNTHEIPEDVIETLALVKDKSIQTRARQLLAKQRGGWHEIRYRIVFA